MAKVLDLKLQLQTTKKGSLSCAQFLQNMQQLADRLRSIGTDVPDQELILYTAQGLGSDFENFVTALSMRATSPSMVEFTSLLLAHEARLLTNLRSLTTSAVHLTTQSDSSAGSAADNVVYYANNSRAPSTYSSRGRSSRGRNTNQRGRGRGRQPNFSSDQLQCQICTKWGHSALVCYHRFDIRYSASSSASPLPDQSSASGSHSVHQALLAEPNLPFQQLAWFIDSGATSHVTNDINAMSSSQSYSGPEAVHIGNGKALPITHKGSIQLSTAVNSLHLRNVLLVPSMTKNLLSVSQLLLDNPVTIEFSSDVCLIKDKTTHQILMHGILHNGLYKLILSPYSQVFQASHASADNWHCRLMHCSSAIQNQLHKLKLISSSPSSSTFCSSCQQAKAHKLPFSPSTSAATQPLEVVHSDL